MSTIQVFRTAAEPTSQPTRKFGSERELAPPTPSKATRDEEMMYAWSIGITSAARAYGEAPRHEEGCPPEVYIG